MHIHTGTIARSIPHELANIAVERGGALTEADALGAGYTKQQLEKHSPKAAEILRLMETRRTV